MGPQISRKKWKDFKCWLNIKFYNPQLPTRRNIKKWMWKKNTPGQWAFLVRTWNSKKAKVLH
jgi:hypothetical protein